MFYQLLEDIKRKFSNNVMFYVGVMCNTELAFKYGVLLDLKYLSLLC